MPRRWRARAFQCPRLFLRRQWLRPQPRHASTSLASAAYPLAGLTLVSFPDASTPSHPRASPPPRPSTSFPPSSEGASSGGARAQASRTCRAQARGSRPPHPRCPGSPARRAVRRGRTRAGAADAQQPRPVSVPAGPESLRPASRCLRVSRRSGLSAPRSFQTAGRTAAQSVQTSRAPLNCLQ